MAERDTQLSREVDVDTDVDVDLDLEGSIDADEDATASERRGLRGRVRERAGAVVSVKSLALALVLVVGGVFLIGGIVGLGTLGDLLGILVGTFLLGVGSDSRRYAESALAGTLAGGTSAFLGNLVLSLIGVGLPVVFLGAVAGGLAGAFGHYLGRDLRDGLTREI
jgi:hypothetical protein